VHRPFQLIVINSVVVVTKQNSVLPRHAMLFSILIYFSTDYIIFCSVVGRKALTFSWIMFIRCG